MDKGSYILFGSKGIFASAVLDMLSGQIFGVHTLVDRAMLPCPPTPPLQEKNGRA